MNYDDALKAAVHATGMFELAERPWPEGLEQFASDEPAPQKMKDALWKDGEKIMAEVLEAIGFKRLLGVSEAAEELVRRWDLSPAPHPDCSCLIFKAEVEAIREAASAGNGEDA